MRKKQLEFDIPKPGASFGGSRLKGNPKSRRPLDGKKPIHLQLKSSKATGPLSMRHPKRHVEINRMVHRIAKKYGIKIFEYVNVGNHLHLLIQMRKTVLWPRFIRELTGRIAQTVQNLKGQERAEKFWDCRPFTRVIAGWKRAYRQAKDYLHLNHLEAEGFIDRRQVKTLRDLRQLLQT